MVTEMHVAMSGPNLAIAISRASKLPPTEVSVGMCLRVCV